MRKIKITSNLEKEVANFNKNLFIQTRNKNFEQPLTRLCKLSKKIKTSQHSIFKNYVDNIINQYSDILNADPVKMKSLTIDFEKIVPISKMGTKLSGKKSKSFHEEIVYAMRYEDLRSIEFPQYLLNSDLRTCVYCNAQSTHTLEPVYYNNKKKKKRKKVISKLQLDHFYPKSKYPFLSTSFFNLYPTCANCNLAKGDEKALFELYTKGNNLDVFNFWIEDQSILDYWLNLDLKKIKINLETLNGDFELFQNHNELFQIQKVYDSQKDVGEELIWKSKANPKVYRTQLNKIFNKIFPDPAIIDRMIIGNYSKPEETFKRPLAKYTQDIAKQLKIIK
jgi:hypothetical protein